MAKQMSYVDPATGAEYPESVWLPMMEEADFARRYVRVEFRGYASFGALAAGKEPIGRRVYTILPGENADPEAFLAFVTAPPVGGTFLDAVSNACYSLASDGFFALADDVPVFFTS